MHKRTLALGIAMVITALPASAAEAPRLTFPLGCTAGQSCWLVGYVDHGTPGAPMDYACGKRTRSGLAATEIAVGDMIAVARGVPVMAMAGGAVRHVRDGMPDGGYLADRASVKDRECGNGVALDHGGGWQTWYCHLRKDSVAVRVGQTVAAGQVIGMAGMSGKAEFPLLSVEVRQDGRAVDPFLGHGATTNCAPAADQLWDEPARSALGYHGADITAAGFSDIKPTALTVDYGAAGKDRLPPDASAMLLWARIFGARGGDEVTLRIDGPDGQPLTQDVTVLPQDRPILTRFAGIERRLAHWPAGQYRGLVVLRRKSANGGDLRIEREASLTVPGHSEPGPGAAAASTAPR